MPRNIDYNNNFISEDTRIVDDLSKKENLNSKNHQKPTINEYSLLPELLKNMENFDYENLKIFNKHFNIQIEALNLTIKTYNKLRRNNIEFIYQLALFSKNDLLKLKNFGKQAYEELIDALINYESQFDNNDINIPIDAFPKEEVCIEILNLQGNIINQLKRRGIKYISDFEKFSKSEIRKFNGFGSLSWSSLLEAIHLYEKINSKQILFKKDNLNEKNKDLYDFWNLIQLKFDKIRENLDFSYVSNIDEHLEVFFSSAYKENSNLRILETLFILSKDEWDDLSDSFQKNSEFVFNVYKYFLFQKFLNFENPIESIHWINDFNKKINYDDNKILKVYFQRILGKTLAEIGKDNRVSRERIRQIESKATRLIGIKSTEMLKITNEIEENLVFKKEKLLCEEYIEKFGHLPYLDVGLGDEINEVFKKCLDSNLKERIEIYKKYNFDIPIAEFDLHYEFITKSKKSVGTGYWLDFKNLEKFLYKHASKLGEPMLMPKQTSLPDAVRGVVTRFGGQSKVASLIGLKYQGQLVNPEGGRKYWTDEKLNILIDDINKFYIQDLYLMPNKTQITNFFKATSINEYKDKKIGSVIAALTKFEQLTWQEVAQRFARKENF